MNKCQKSGCRHLETRCKDCGRLVIEKNLLAIQEWISVKDRLPEESLNVLVFVHEDNRQGTSIAYYLDNRWWGGIYQGENEPFLEVFEDDYRFYLQSCCVSHWMPLPEPPKEEK
jgi:hypothetical protein